MGKKQQRGRRHRQPQIRKPQAPTASTPERYLFPSAEAPLLEVLLTPEVTDSQKETALAYWQFDEPGTWTRKVADIGTSHLVVQKVKAAGHAVILTCVCPECASPWPVHSRSEVTAAVSWHPEYFPREQTEARMPCTDCRQARDEAARQEREQEAAAAQRRDDERAANASAWLTDHDNRKAPEGYPELGDALFLLSALEIMEKTGKDSFGPLNKLDYNVAASDEADLEALRRLYVARWLAPTLPATVGDFAYEEDNSVRGVYLTQVPFRLTKVWSANARRARGEVLQLLRLHLLDNAEALHGIVRGLEASIAIAYLDGLLTRKYREDPIPEHRLPDAYETFTTALAEGFTLGQLLAVAWSATASSVAWGQRTPGLKPGSVPSASVTNLERGIGYAKDRPVREYELPNSVPQPSTYATARRVLAQHEAELDAMSRFLKMRQRVASRDQEAMAFEEHLPEPSHEWHDASLEEFVDDLKESRQRPPADEPTLMFAVVTTDGQLEFREAAPSEMREEVGSAGAHVVDRIVPPEDTRVNAYIAELVPASDSNRNEVADEMLRLLDCYDGPFLGPIAFFSVASSRVRPQGLDEDQQEMLRAAHEIARGRTAKA